MSELPLTLKKSGYILLLIILTCQPGGMLLFYKFQQAFRKLEMEEILMTNDNRFQPMNLSVADFHRFKVDDHELCINGEMYDIKKAVVFSDSVELVVIRDKDEENIMKRIFSVVHKTHTPDRDFSNQLKQLLSLNYISPQSSQLSFVVSKETLSFNFEISFHISEYIEISSPPPWKG